MSFCSNCGSEVKEGQAICLNCGFALKGNAAPTASASPMFETVYTDRVQHDIFKLMPAFDGPIGRMEYFTSALKLFGISLFVAIGVSIPLQLANGNDPIMSALALLFALLTLFVYLQMAVQGIALTYKRIWDMGVNDNGSRVGFTLGFYIIAMIPLLNLFTIALFFIPGRR